MLKQAFGKAVAGSGVTGALIILGVGLASTQMAVPAALAAMYSGWNIRKVFKGLDQTAPELKTAFKSAMKSEGAAWGLIMMALATGSVVLAIPAAIATGYSGWNFTKVYKALAVPSQEDVSVFLPETVPPVPELTQP